MTVLFRFNFTLKASDLSLSCNDWISNPIKNLGRARGANTLVRGRAVGARLSERVRLATAAVALKAIQPGDQRGISTRNQVDEFLQPSPPNGRERFWTRAAGRTRTADPSQHIDEKTIECCCLFCTKYPSIVAWRAVRPQSP